MHLEHIARMFAAGDFNAPMVIHDRVPPGVPTLKRLKSSVSYEFQQRHQVGASGSPPTMPRRSKPFMTSFASRSPITRAAIRFECQCWLASQGIGATPGALKSTETCPSTQIETRPVSKHPNRQGVV